LNRFRYFVVHKPYGYLSQFSGENGDLTLQDLVIRNHLNHFPKDVYPVGRLDKDSEGLLLLTNDNQLKNKLLEPKNEHYKTYWAQVEGSITSDAIWKLTQGGIQIKHNGKTHSCLPAKVQIVYPTQLEERNPPIRFRASIPTTWIEIQLREGKNRQIRKMTAAVGFPTLRLIRVGILKLRIESFPIGKIQEIPKTAIVI
jgi:23S rRNA pseudouridine2457 synthase